MAWVRKLPSGKWAATVRLPGDRKITKTFPLKGAADRWAADQEASLLRGDWIDPREGAITVGDWWERCKDSRALELASRKRDASHWRCHVEPHWCRIPLTAILQPDVDAWVVKMQRAGVGADTIIGAVKVLRGLLEQAVAARRIRFNPARGVSLPRPNVTVFRVLAPGEDEILLKAFYQRFPGRPECGLFVELLLDTGMRWEEAAGLMRNYVDLRNQRINVGPVMERDGRVRFYAKSDAGNRQVPVGRLLWPRLRDHVMTRSAEGLVFTTALGRPLDYSRWLSRVWNPALTVPTERGPRNKILATEPVLPDPQPTPHDLRHTYGTRLGEQGVPQHEIMALMGHKDARASSRYIHAGEARFDRAREAMERARQGAGS